MNRRRTALWAGLGASVVVLSAFMGLGTAMSSGAPANVAPNWDESNNTTSPNAPNYTVTFTEVGLPPATNWTVVVCITWWCGDDDGANFGTSNTSTITFQLPNGTFHYRVSGEPGYTLNGSRGFVTVAGAAPSAITVTFTKLVPYAVEFNESGLPAGTNWTVLIFGFQMGGAGFFHTNATSSSSTITFQLTNGTYLYVIERVSGWHITSGMRVGVITVHGASPAETSVVFGQDS